MLALRQTHELSSMYPVFHPQKIHKCQLCCLLANLMSDLDGRKHRPPAVTRYTSCAAFLKLLHYYCSTTKAQTQRSTRKKNNAQTCAASVPPYKAFERVSVFITASPVRVSLCDVNARQRGDGQARGSAMGYGIFFWC